MRGIIFRTFSTSRTLFDRSYQVSAVIQRCPVITPDKNPFEEAHEEYADNIYREKTRPFPEAALQQFNLNLVKEDEFVLFAPRVTEADKLNDRKSLERALQRTLYLIVHQDGIWKFPTNSVEDQELLPSAGDRLVKEFFDGRSFDEKITNKTRLRYERNSNQPVAVFVPSESDLKKYKKTYFYNYERLTGDLTIDKKRITDHFWLTREELSEYFEKSYLQQLSPLFTF